MTTPRDRGVFDGTGGGRMCTGRAGTRERGGTDGDRGVSTGVLGGGH